MTVNKKHQVVFFALFLLSIILAVANVLLTLLIKSIVDSLTEGTDTWKSTILIFSLIVCSILLVEFGRKILIAKYKCALVIWFQSALCENTRNWDVRKIRGHSPQEYISIINNEITMVVEDYYIELVEVLFQIISILIGCITLSVIYLPLSIISILSSIIIVFIPVLFKRYLGGLNELRMQSLRKYNVALKDMLFGYSEIRIRNMFESIKTIITSKQNDYMTNEYRFCKANACSQILIGAVSFINLLLILLVGGRNVAANNISIGSMIAAIQLSDMLTQPIIGVSNSLSTVLSTYRIKKNLAPYYASSKKSCFCSIKEIKEVEFRNITIVRDGKCIINNFSYCFKKGRKYLLLGKNGSGKSSLIDLLIYPELLNDAQGDLLINGIDRGEISNSCIYSLISFITQDPYIFSATIQDNVSCFGESTIRFPEALGRIKDDFFSHTIEQNRTVSGEDESLSGGERQKIVLLRALQKEQEWIILDESLSSMDAESREEVEDFLLNENGKTIIHISHITDKEGQGKYDEVITL